jgi:hypothetical protein
MSHNNQGYPPDATTTLLHTMARHRPSAQERLGDEKLDRARAMTGENESVIAEEDLRTIESKITQ